ncbi:MAG: hypothetical protein OXP68_00385 [Anaerolineaceae bacterium]|nr:hypothetical protein [Anaerolineaceae bacterium]MDE0328371.1 hypothetical protein [Anaerolineaceae bacterium]
MKRSAARSNRRRVRLPTTVFLLASTLVGLCLGLILAWSALPAISPGAAGVLQGLPPEEFAALVAQAWSADGDRARAMERLRAAIPHDSDPARHMADMACRLASTEFADSSAGLRTLRKMQNFYQMEGQRSCADTLLPAVDSAAFLLLDSSPTPRPSATLPPPPGKTPMPTLTPVVRSAATEVPTATATTLRRFELAGLGGHCDAARPATLAVYVQERDGRGIAGMALRVRWRGGEDRFHSGLKPERGAGYADFIMEQGRRYVIDMPGLSDASPEFETGSCVEDGTQTMRSWRALFRPVN